MGTKALRLEDLSSESGFKLFALTVDVPGEKVNTLGASVIGELTETLDQLKREHAKNPSFIDALVLRSAKPGNFVAGADIKLFQTVKTADQAAKLSAQAQALFSHWEDLPFPTIAAIQGTALGGGCEWALASTAIVMANDGASRIGLPEVLLGILPGAGGCVRMPNRVGLVQALDLILSGKTLTADKARKIGLVDAALQYEDFWPGCVKWIKANLSALKSGSVPRKTLVNGWLEGNPVGRKMIFGQAHKGVMQKTKGQYPAPLEVLAVLQANGISSGRKVRGAQRERALAREAQAFGRLAVTDVSRYLIQLFFLTEGIKKATGLPAGTTVATSPVKVGGVLGAGVMGGGIAQLFAEKNITTRMKDITPAALNLGLQAASTIFKKSVKKRKINAREYLQKMNLIAPVLDFSGFRSTEVVVEAVIEKMDIKKKVLAELETHVTDTCVIATNTSSLSVSGMQEALKRPERFVGMHFFNPVHKMPLIEVIRGEKTDDRAVAVIFALSKQIGKTPIVVKDAPGFLVNRLLVPYMNEAMMCVADGMPIDAVDRALLRFGMPMGPLELIDEVGVDVGDKVLHILHAAFGDRMVPCPIAEKVVKSGRLGKKTSKGIYEYVGSGERKQKVLQAEIYSIMGVQPNGRAAQGSSAEAEIVDRCILPMVNEAARCLEEKIVATPADCDLGMIMGTGFPPFRGGLLRYADARGLSAIVDRLEALSKSVGKRFEPSDALKNVARQSKTFYTG